MDHTPIPRMLPLYGSKWRMAKKYPPPEYDEVHEPFAGGAGYSLWWGVEKARLYDVDEHICGIWEYLISVKASELRKIPTLREGDNVDDFKIPQEAKWLIGFWIHPGTASPQKMPSTMWKAAQGDSGKAYSVWSDAVRDRIAENLKRIRKWRIESTSYADIPPRETTWFVDPPYKMQGKHYRFGSDGIDYEHLAKWCKQRDGQVIVCEGARVRWLPFKKLSGATGHLEDSGQRRRYTEYVWMKSS